jgi:hypothetical protein
VLNAWSPSLFFRDVENFDFDFHNKVRIHRSSEYVRATRSFRVLNVIPGLRLVYTVTSHQLQAVCIGGFSCVLYKVFVSSGLLYFIELFVIFD